MPAHAHGFPNPWRSPLRVSQGLCAAGLCMVVASAMTPGPTFGLMAPGIALAVFMAGAWAFARARAVLIEPDLASLRRGEAVMRWDLEPEQWTRFAARRRLRLRALLVGGSAGISLVPALLFAVLRAGPPDAQSAATSIGWALAGVCTLTLIGVLLVGRANREPQPVVFAPKLCAVGSTVFAWPHGIAMIELDEKSQMLSITRKGASSMPALTFGIPVPQNSLDEARTLLPS